MKSSASIGKFAVVASIGAILFVMASLLPIQFDIAPQPLRDRPGLFLRPQAVLAQAADGTAAPSGHRSNRQPIDREDQAQKVYQLLPDLPLENQYVNITTGQTATNNTLIRRLIDYHIYVRSRSPIYRLDWKLTLADYLGVNQWVNPATYPGGDSLRPSPVAGDLAAINRLDRVQREALVAALVQAFGGAAPVTAAPLPPAPSPVAPVETQPGAAQFLLP